MVPGPRPGHHRVQGTCPDLTGAVPSDPSPWRCDLLRRDDHGHLLPARMPGPPEPGSRAGASPPPPPPRPPGSGPACGAGRTARLPWRWRPARSSSAGRCTSSATVPSTTAPETDLAARLGVSARHLRRLFAEHVGTTPDQLARSRRTHFARRLLDDTDLTVTDIAYASGFGSLRQLQPRLSGGVPRLAHRPAGPAPARRSTRDRRRPDPPAARDAGPSTGTRWSATSLAGPSAGSSTWTGRPTAARSSSTAIRASSRSPPEGMTTCCCGCTSRTSAASSTSCSGPGGSSPSIATRRRRSSTWPPTPSCGHSWWPARASGSPAPGMPTRRGCGPSSVSRSAWPGPAR